MNIRKFTIRKITYVSVKI